VSDVDPFLIQIPKGFRDIDDALEWATFLHQFLEDLRTRTGGETDTVGDTADSVSSQADQIDDLETQADANTAALESLQDSLPVYSISNDGTDRAFSADAAAGAITNPPTQAEVENIRDAVLEIADVLATLIRDLGDKDLLG